MYKQHYVWLFTLLVTVFGCKGERIPATRAETIAASHETTLIVLSAQNLHDAGLEYVTVGEEALPERISAPAVLVPSADAQAVVISPLDGVIDHVVAREGQDVRKGDPLCYFRSIQLESYKAEYLRRQSELKLARSSFERQERLHEKSLLSDQEFLEATNTYEVAQAEFKGIDGIIGSLGFSKTELGLEAGAGPGKNIYALRAPISGTVLARNATAGMKLDTNAALFQIAQTDKLWAQAQVSATDANRIAAGDHATFRLQGDSLELPAGIVDNIGTSLDEHTRTVTVRVLIANAKRALRPQMFGDVDIFSSEMRSSLAIPAAAILQEHTGSEIRTYVFLKQNDSTFEKRYIHASPARSGLAAVASGLQKGDVIVSAGQFILKSTVEKDKLNEDRD